LADQHHVDAITGRSTRDGVQLALNAIGHQVRLVPLEERDVAEDDFQDMDVLAICHTVFESSPETRRIVGDWIFGDKPTVFLHCGIGAWPDWQALREATGRYWIWPESLVPADAGKQGSGHPFVPCEISVPDVETFTTGWAQAWLPVDEVYCDLADGEPIEVLATTMLNESEEPVAWRNAQRPNITVWLPGHRADIWELPMMRDGLRAVVDLATG